MLEQELQGVFLSSRIQDSCSAQPLPAAHRRRSGEQSTSGCAGLGCALSDGNRAMNTHRSRVGHLPTAAKGCSGTQPHPEGLQRGNSSMGSITGSSTHLQMAGIQCWYSGQRFQCLNYILGNVIKSWRPCGCRQEPAAVDGVRQLLPKLKAPGPQDLFPAPLLCSPPRLCWEVEGGCP